MNGSIAEALASGLKLMLIGMGTVFFFLLLLVGIIQLTHRFLRWVETRAPSRNESRIPEIEVDNAAEEELVAVIGAAVHHYEQP